MAILIVDSSYFMSLDDVCVSSSDVCLLDHPLLCFGAGCTENDLLLNLFVFRLGMNSFASSRLATELLGLIILLLGSLSPKSGARVSSSGNLELGWHRYFPDGEFLILENLPSFILALDPLSIDR